MIEKNDNRSEISMKNTLRNSKNLDETKIVLPSVINCTDRCTVALFSQ